MNTATLAFSRGAVARLVALTGHRMHLVKVPEKQQRVTSNEERGMSNE